jgi:hypothetical protein
MAGTGMKCLGLPLELQKCLKYGLRYIRRKNNGGGG